MRVKKKKGPTASVPGYGVPGLEYKRGRKMAKQTLGSCRRSLVVRELVMGTHPVDSI